MILKSNPLCFHKEMIQLLFNENQLSKERNKMNNNSGYCSENQLFNNFLMSLSQYFNNILT